MFWFLPTRATLTHWRELPQARYALPRDPALTEVGRAIGPDGLSGTVFHDGAAPALPELTWRKSRRAALWIGWATAMRPGPADLQRGGVAGFPVQLADGAQWIIPLVPGGLPRVPTPDGPVADPRYADLIETADRVRKMFAGDDSAGAGLTARYAYDLLGVAYRLGPDEIEALDLFGDDPRLVGAVAAASVGSHTQAAAMAVSGAGEGR